jgi:HK97 gp10 family phage protein
MAIKSGSIEGLDELITDFLTLGDRAMPYLKSATDYSSAILLNSARSKIRSRTGKLAEALRVVPARISKTKKMIVSGQVVLSNEYADRDAMKYGAYVELGHNLYIGKVTYGAGHVQTGGKWIGHVKPHPFMRPAADENKARVENILVVAVERALREIGDK